MNLFMQFEYLDPNIIGIGDYYAFRNRYAIMGGYRDPDGLIRSAGSYSTRREAQRAANREEQKVFAGSWHDSSLGDVTFRDYVETEWLPHKTSRPPPGPPTPPT